MPPPLKSKDRGSDSSAQPSRQLVILSKPSDKSKSVANQSAEVVTPSSPTSHNELKPPIVLQKSKETHDHDSSRSASPGTMTLSSGSQGSKDSDPYTDLIKNFSQKVYHIQQKPSPSTSSVVDESKLLPPPEMVTPVKLVDDSLQWCDNALEYLNEGNDFYVIGVIGLQNTGKSTVLSEIAGWPIFKTQTLEMKEKGSHCTSGIDVFVTSERLILLDAQPLLSASVMDTMILYEKYEKKSLGSADYYSAESSLYIQSMQIVAFLMSVCHTIISVQDWFVDLNYLRFILSCEMLKPVKPLYFDSKSEVITEHYPHIVFVQNLCGRKEYEPVSVERMNLMLHSVFQNSKMVYNGLVYSSAMDKKQGETESEDHKLSENEMPKVNLFLLPKKGNEENGIDEDRFPQYKGHPTYKQLSKSLVHQVLAMPVQQLAYWINSEKDWFLYASRIWDTVKKVNDFNEYRRHLVSIP